MTNQADGRTTPIGLIHYAHSYAESAQWLLGARIRATHPDAPIRFLYIHAIELYLKAFLMQKGVTDQELKGLGHNTSMLVESAISRGLEVNQTQKDQISCLTDAIRDRYIETGTRHTLLNETLHGLCFYLDKKIGPFIYEENGLNRRRYTLNPGDSRRD